MKSKKLKNIIGSMLLIFMTMLSATFLSACAKKIRPAEVYKQLESAPTSIEVTFDDECVGEFTLTDSEQIATVYNFIIGHEYEYVTEIMPASNIYLKLIYENGKDISLSTRYITYRDRTYAIGTVNEFLELDIYLQDIGLENGWIEYR